jgi:hypothetical protein
MNSLSTTDNSVAVGKLPAGISVYAMEVDFPDATAHRSAKIFGNGYNNLPVRVRFKINRTDEHNKVTNVSGEWKDKVYLYDVSSNKGISADGGQMHGAFSDELVCHLHKNNYTLGFYENGAAETQAADDGMIEKVFYVSTKKALTSLKEFKLGAFLSPEHSATLTSGVSSGVKATVVLTTMQPIDYADPSSWKCTHISTSAIPVPGNFEVHGIDVSKVSGKSSLWHLTHSMVPDNSPITMTVVSINSFGAGFLRGNVSSVAGTKFTEFTAGKPNKYQYIDWYMAGRGDITIDPGLYREPEAAGQYILSKHPITLQPGSSSLNANARNITVLQAAMTVSFDGVAATVSHMSGSITLRDNVGHNQGITLTASTDGSIAVTGKG